MLAAGLGQPIPPTPGCTLGLGRATWKSCLAVWLGTFAWDTLSPAELEKHLFLSHLLGPKPWAVVASCRACPGPGPRGLRCGGRNRMSAATALLSTPPSPHLPVTLPLPQLGLLWVVEPLDLHHHVAAPRLPHALDAANVGQVGPPSRQEDGTVPDVQRLLAPDDGLVEQLPGLPLHAPPLQGDTQRQG